MPGILACSCKNLPMCMVEWSIDKYIFFSPGKPYELHVPYEILNSEFTQERIIDFWHSEMHKRFCRNTGFTRLEDCYSNHGKVLFKVGSWLCLNAKPENYPQRN